MDISVSSNLTLYFVIKAEDARKIIDVCNGLMEVFDILDPGLSQTRGLTLSQMVLASMTLGQIEDKDLRLKIDLVTRNEEQMSVILPTYMIKVVQDLITKRARILETKIWVNSLGLKPVASQLAPLYTLYCPQIFRRAYGAPQ